MDLTARRVLAFESADSALVEGSSDYHDDPSQSSELTTVVKKILLCVSLPAPRIPGKGHQIIFPHSRFVRRNDDSRVIVTGA